MKSGIVMVQISQSFFTAYYQLPKAIQKKIERQLTHLAQDITHPGLRARKMTAKNGIWEARVDRRYRFTFELFNGAIHLRTVGRHDIYQRP